MLQKSQEGLLLKPVRKIFFQSFRGRLPPLVYACAPDRLGLTMESDVLDP